MSLGRCRRWPVEASMAVHGEVDITEYVVIDDAAERQTILRQSQVQAPLNEDQIVLAVKNAQKGKASVIKEIRASADYLDKQQRDMNIAKTSFASAGIIASVLTVVGLVLAPVSAGGSLGLTGAGIAIGVASGSGGIATEIADRIINSKALKKAQRAIDDHNKRSEHLLQLMDSLREVRGDKGFKKFIEGKLRNVSPQFYDWIVTHLRNEIRPAKCNPEPGKAGVRAAAAAGKIASEVFEAGSKAIKFGSLVCSVLTVPLDLHTIVSCSIKIHKKTPSETADHMRKLADELESGGSKLDETSEWKRRAKSLEREAGRRKQQWLDSMRKIGHDVAYRLEDLATMYDSLKRQALRIQVFSISTHIAARFLVLYIFPILLTSDPAVWIRRGAVVSLIYDGFYLVLNFVMEAYTFWIVCESRKEIEKGIYAARHGFESAPLDVLSSAEERSRSTHALFKPGKQDRSKYHNVFELGLVAFKSLLNIVILNNICDLSDLPGPNGVHHSQTFVSYMISWLWATPESESSYSPDLVIMWAAVCVCLLINTTKEQKENSVSPLARDIIEMGGNFKNSMNELLGESCRDSTLVNGTLSYNA